jgi:hypothetical protein
MRQVDGQRAAFDGKWAVGRGRRSALRPSQVMKAVSIARIRHEMHVFFFIFS